MYDDSIESHINLEQVTSEDLLDIIGDNSYILSYIIDNWNNYFGAAPNQFTPEVLKEVLKEMGLKRHFLTTIAISNWEYSNYKEYQLMLKKVGRPSERYAILPEGTSEQNASLLADQVILYNTEAQARAELFGLKIRNNQPIQ